MRKSLIGLTATVIVSISFATAAWSAEPAPTCEASKLSTTAKYASCRLKAESKAVKTGSPVDYSKCGLDKFADAEARAGAGVCPTENDQASIGDFLDSCTVSVAVALAGGGLPPDALTCNEDLTTCQGDLSTTNADLGTCNGSLGTCTGDLATCNGSLTTCSGGLTTCQGDLSTTNADLGTCNGSLGTCSGDLGTCNGSLTTCSGGLTTCQGDLSTANANLGTCNGSLATCTGDLGTCNGSLGTCTGNLATCTGSLTTCSGDLTSCQGDLSTTNADLTGCTTDLSATNADLSNCQGDLGTANSGTAGAGDVVAGKTFTSSAGLGATGTMPNNGAVTLTPGTTDQAIATGYHNGSGKCGGDSDLVAGNIKDGVNLFGVTGTLSCGGLAKTGQTTCYDALGAVISCAGSGQDGEYQRGVAASYTDNLDGTITDNLTGLVWEKLSDDGSIHDKDTTYAWTTAVTTKIAALNSTNFAGHGDWRLPNIKELETLKNFGAAGPATWSVFHSGCAASCSVTSCSCTQSNDYWSSSTYQNNATSAWGVYFLNGSTFALTKSSGYYVRGVRAGS